MDKVAWLFVDYGASLAAKAVKEQGSRNGPNPNILHKLIDSSELHVILIGTGTPIIVENRSGPCTAIVGAGHFFLVDVGPGSYRTCSLLGLPLGRLSEEFWETVPSGLFQL